MQLGLQDSSLREEKLLLAEKSYLDYINKYPNNHRGYVQLSNLYMINGNLEGVIKFAEQGVAILSDYFGFRNLIIAHQKLEQYSESSNVFERAYQLDEKIVADIDAVTSASISYAMIGNMRMSKGLLFEIAGRNPEVKSDPLFVETVNFVKAKEEGSANDR